MHILLFIPFTQNSQSALFHDAKIPNFALFASQKFPIWGVPDPFPMRQKKSLWEPTFGQVRTSPLDYLIIDDHRVNVVTDRLKIVYCLFNEIISVLLACHC